MKILYQRSKDRKLCTDEYKATKQFGNKNIAQDLFDLLTAIEEAEDLNDILLPQYRLHPLEGNKNNIYSLTIPKTKYRIEIIPLDKDNNELICKTDLKTFYQTVKNIRIKEISEHYEK